METGKILQENYEKLVDKLTNAGDIYYSGSKDAIMDDREYDIGIQEIKKFENSASKEALKAHNLFKVGGGNKGSGDLKHSTDMLSLDNVFSEEALENWVANIHVDQLKAAKYKNLKLVVEPKLDGLALSIRYSSGKLVDAGTRGNGETGEDVSAQVANLHGLPKVITGPLAGKTFCVRGEVFLTHDGFEAANQVRVANNKESFSNPRNAAAGLLRNKAQDGSALSFLGYDLSIDDGVVITSSHSINMKILAESGINAVKPTLAGIDTNTVLELVTQLGKERESLNYDIDGAVIKVDNLMLRRSLGSTGRAPRWAIAYKYPSDTRLTTLKAIVIDVGRTGRCTPVALLEPVKVGGVVIERATLHNESEITRKNLRIGDKVWVRRAGEVIPEVVGPNLSLREASSKAYKMPKVCPSCGGSLNVDEVIWRCTNKVCGLVPRIEYFASRKAMDIDGLGVTTVQALVNNKLVEDVSDLYKLTYENLINIERLGDVSANKLLYNIEKSKSNSLAKVLCGLGIRKTGRTISKRLAEYFGTIEAICAADLESISLVEGVGSLKGASIVAELLEIAPTITELKKQGVLFTSGSARTLKVETGISTLEGELSKDSSSSSKFISNKRVCISGSIPGMTREQAGQEIENLGGSVASSVSKNVDFLVSGEGSGSKVAKAKQLAVKIITPEEFLKLLD